MVLVDTSAWIEWLIGSPTGDLLAEHLPEESEWLVPTIVQLELAKWLTRGMDGDKADQIVAFTQVCQAAFPDRTRHRWTGPRTPIRHSPKGTL
jgi:uncharacterized protein with PIN domain